MKAGTIANFSAQLAAMLDDYKVGENVRVEVWREGKQVQLTARLRVPVTPINER
ncbi:MAG TPA: hypothetical protein VFS23_06195 [Vicinamibacterales bacterium]|nr:hypothetical protein [Vicinamibacterales bacterium]